MQDKTSLQTDDEFKPAQTYCHHLTNMSVATNAAALAQSKMTVA